jgi:hypothetical protein
MKLKTSIACLMITLLFDFPAWCDEPREISEMNQKMSFDFNEVGVKTALSLFEEVTGLEFVYDECVQGRITIQATNVPLNDLFRMVLNEAGLDYEQNGNDIWITCKADSKATISDPDKSTALPGIKALVFASIKEKGKGEMEALWPKMERDFLPGIFMICPSLHSNEGEQSTPPFFLKTIDQNNYFFEKPQFPLEIKFTLKKSSPEGVEVKISFSYNEELENDLDNQIYNTISGVRQRYLNPNDPNEPIFLFASPAGDEYYFSVLPEEWSPRP